MFTVCSFYKSSQNNFVHSERWNLTSIKHFTKNDRPNGKCLWSRGFILSFVITRYYSSITGVFLQTRKRSFEIADKFKMFAIFEREPNFRTPFLPTNWYYKLYLIAALKWPRRRQLQDPYCHHRHYVPLHPHHSDVRNLITRWASLHFYSNTIEEVQYFLHSFLHPSSPRAVVLL